MERYEISAPEEGVIAFRERRTAAFLEANRLIWLEGLTARPIVVVFDRMAHFGNPELWEISRLFGTRIIRWKSKEA
jgi:hypothetical protein